MKKIILSVLFLLLAKAAIASPAQLCSRNLPFGAPTVNTSTTEVCHIGYAAAVDDHSLVPRWVIYRLTAEHSIGCYPRENNFHADQQLSKARHQEPGDYVGSGYVRGHQAPAEDFAWDREEMSDSFSMANMAPQLPGLGGWEYLEESVRAWAFARGELIVYTGPVVPSRPHSIGQNEVAVPIAFWKIVIDPNRREGSAFLMPQSAVSKGDLRRWETTISNIEAQSGVSLNLPGWLDRDRLFPVWKAAIAGWRKQKSLECTDR